MENNITSSSYSSSRYNYCPDRLPCGFCKKMLSPCPLNPSSTYFANAPYDTQHNVFADRRIPKEAPNGGETEDKG